MLGKSFNDATAGHTRTILYQPDNVLREAPAA